MSPDTRKSGGKKRGRMGGNDRVVWGGRRGSEVGRGREEDYNGPLGKLSHLSGRVLRPPEGSLMAWKEPRPGKLVSGSSPGSATC